MKEAAISRIEEVTRKFAGVPADTPEAKIVAGTALAVAQEWLIRLPEGTAKDEALDHLYAAAGRACDAWELSTQDALRDITADEDVAWLVSALDLET